MNLSEKTAELKKAVALGEQCAIYFRGEEPGYYCFPLAFSDKLLLCAEEVDFLADGFAVHKLFDVEEVEILSDKYAEILKSEGVRASITVPDLDLESWHSVFFSLMNAHKLVMIERASDRDAGPTMGRIVSINDKMLGLKSFDRYGEWSDVVIPFAEVLCVAFDNRYLKVWEKYV